jgi:phage terminase large subunit-like protein
MLYPARWTKPLTEHFDTDADKLLAIVELAYRDADNPEGLVLDDWQKWLIRHVLERYPLDWPDQSIAGQLRFRSVIISVPRQSGKSLIASILGGIWGLTMRTGQVLGVASSSDQARIIYDRVLHTIMANPELKEMFKKTTERRGIVSADGLSRYDVKPAKESSLQGIKVDTILFDEVHLARKGMWSAMVQGTAASQQIYPNPKTGIRDGAIIIGITTAGDASSETLIDLYKQGERSVNGDPALERFGFFCWEAPEGSDIDGDAILASNPAVECGRIPLERVLGDLATIPEHEARRYRLNQFISGVSESWLPMPVFHANAGHGIGDLEGSVLSVSVNSKLDFGTIAAAKKVGDKVQTELVASLINPSENRLYDLLVTLYKTHKCSAIVIDGGNMPSLQKRLKNSGYPLWQLWSKEVAAACSTTFALFQQNKIEHNNDPLLIAQMPRGVARYVGENWYLSRKASLGDIDSVLATILAVYVANIEKAPSIGVF